MGKLRTQFWKDTIDKAFAVCMTILETNWINKERLNVCLVQNNPPKQPVALALADAMKQVSFSPMWFKRIINERVSDWRSSGCDSTTLITDWRLLFCVCQEENLDDPQFMTIKDMEKYAENTASCLLYLQLESLKIRDVNADHIVSHIGKVIGISTLLRALPFHASQKRLILPAEVTAKVKIKRVRTWGRDWHILTPYKIIIAQYCSRRRVSSGACRRFRRRCIWGGDHGAWSPFDSAIHAQISSPCCHASDIIGGNCRIDQCLSTLPHPWVTNPISFNFFCF